MCQNNDVMEGLGSLEDFGKDVQKRNISAARVEEMAKWTFEHSHRFKVGEHNILHGLMIETIAPWMTRAGENQGGPMKGGFNSKEEFEAVLGSKYGKKLEKWEMGSPQVGLGVQALV